MSQRPKSETPAATNARQTSPKSAEAHRIYVKDADPSREEPLSAFMVPSKYVSPPTARAAQPKRPLNPARTPEKVKMYSQIGALDAAYRIRRPRTTIPVADISSKKDEAVVQLRHFGKRAAGFAAAIFAFVAAKFAGVWRFITVTAHRIFQVGSKTKYSAISGAAVRKFGMPRAWFRTSAALAALLIVFGLGILGGWFSDGNTNGGNGASSGTGGSVNGNAVIQVQPSSDTTNGQPDTSTPQTAGAPASGGASSNAVQPSSGTVQGAAGNNPGGNYSAAGGSAPAIGGVGGRGGGGTATSPATYTPSTTTTPSVGSGGGSSTPSPSGGSGGSGTTPPSSGGSGGGETLTPLPVAPVPSVPEVPSKDCLCSTLQQAPQTVNSTVNATTGIIPNP